MRLDEIYSKKSIKDKISFEVYPPKDENGTSALIRELAVLKKFNPAFVSLTYGANGSENNSDKLIETIGTQGFEVMPHFTCVCSSKEFVQKHIEYLKALKIDKILALRGDIPEDKTRCKYDFEFASNLVEYLAENTDMSIGVAGYPEGHIEAVDLKTDISNMKVKNERASVIFTQLFYDNEKFYEYKNLLSENGTEKFIVAGIMPVMSVRQIEKMTSLAKITIPKVLREALEMYSEDPVSLQDFGVDYVSKQCQELIEKNVDGLHFFTLNKSSLTARILNNIL